MQVILTKRVPKLGYEHDVVEVKPGFAQNYLFPQKFAVPASGAELRRAQILKGKRLKKLDETIAKAKEVAEKLKEVVLSFKKKVRGDKLYGSISEKDIVAALQEQAKVEIKKDMVHMSDHFKTLGDFKVKIELVEGVEVTMKVKIEKED